MLTQELINGRLNHYEIELKALQSAHDEMVKEFQAKAQTNQSRFAQITGAIAELKELSKQTEGKNDEHSIHTASVTDRTADVRVGQ